MKSFPVAALAVFILAGCNDEDSAQPPTDPIEVLKAAHVRDLASALTEAYEQCECRNFAAGIALCNYVLTREPEYCVAVEFAEGLALAKTRMEEGDEFYFSFLMAKVNNWKKLTRADEVATVPYMETLTYPQLHLPQQPEVNPTGFMMNLEHSWPPDLAKVLQEEVRENYPNLLVSGDWRGRTILFMTFDGPEIWTDLIPKLQARVRELDQPAEEPLPKFTPSQDAPAAPDPVHEHAGKQWDIET